MLCPYGPNTGAAAGAVRRGGRPYKTETGPRRAQAGCARAKPETGPCRATKLAACGSKQGLSIRLTPSAGRIHFWVAKYLCRAQHAVPLRNRILAVKRAQSAAADAPTNRRSNCAVRSMLRPYKTANRTAPGDFSGPLRNRTPVLQRAQSAAADAPTKPNSGSFFRAGSWCRNFRRWFGPCRTGSRGCQDLCRWARPG
jgi:hypothetical protein